VYRQKSMRGVSFLCIHLADKGKFTQIRAEECCSWCGALFDTAAFSAVE